MKQLFLGGARSGKSRLAEQAAMASGLAVSYIATSQAHDDEMRARIAHHAARRPVQWALVEEPIRLAETLRQHAAAGRCLLVDCLTLWLSNLLCADDEAQFAREREALLQALPALPGEILFVSNEVGQGIVPMNALSRRFVDESGWLHQALAERCERVTFVVAGLPQRLKDSSPPSTGDT